MTAIIINIIIVIILFIITIIPASGRRRSTRGSNSASRFEPTRAMRTKPDESKRQNKQPEANSWRSNMSDDSFLKALIYDMLIF